MELTGEQYQRIKECLPLQRGNVRIDNLRLLHARLFVQENACQWRAAPRDFGNWQTAYRLNRPLDRRRNEGERFLRRRKGFRRVFTRYDELDMMFTAFVHLALIFDALK